MPSTLRAFNSGSCITLTGCSLRTINNVQWIHCDTRDNVFYKGVSFYEFDPAYNTFTQQSNPTGGLVDNAIPAFQTTMLCLPDGKVLYSRENSQLYVYTPTGSPIAAGKPTVLSVSKNTDGSLHLAGTLFNGISAGAAYGDDAQMDTNFPIVRFTDAGGTVRYGRSYNWSSTGVATGNTVLTTECTLPAGASLQDSIQVVANGNASSPVNYPLYGGDTKWADFNAGATFPYYYGDGSFGIPFVAIGYAVSGYIYCWSSPFPDFCISVPGVAQGGILSIKSSNSAETIRITKPMRIITSGGPSRIGP